MLRKRRPRRGAALAETAIVLPLFILFILGLIEFARAFMIVQLLNYSVRAGGREGILQGTSSATATQIIRDKLRTGGLDPDKATIAILDGQQFDMRDNADMGTFADMKLEPLELRTALPRHLTVVRVLIPYRDASLFAPWFFKDTTLEAQIVMRHE